MIKAIPVFYSEEMNADSGHAISPSASKPAKVVQDWESHSMPIKVYGCTAAPVAAITLAHDRRHVQGVLDGTIRNGFGTFDKAVARAATYQCGSLMAAAKYVMANRRFRPVAVSPSSGFHHAHWADCGGYCTFNGLMVTAMNLLMLHADITIGILDFDYHWGDGTAAIIKRVGGDRIKHISAGSDHTRSAADILRLSMLGLSNLGRCDLLLYQAGADQHIDDPLGGVLTTEQMAQRDRNVFAAAREFHVPLVWNLAGGYQTNAKGSIEPVLALHRQTMQQCSDIFIHQLERVEEKAKP